MKYKYSYCGQCDGVGRTADECGPGCHECGNADWLEMLEDDISDGHIEGTLTFEWIEVRRPANYPDMRPEGHKIAREKFHRPIRVELTGHGGEVVGVYYLNADEATIEKLEAARTEERRKMEEESVCWAEKWGDEEE